MNYELYKELANPSMDLRCRKGETYSGRSVAEGRHHSLDRFRLMQRPKSTKTKVRCGGGRARATVGGERKKTRKGKNEERPGRVYL